MTDLLRPTGRDAAGSARSAGPAAGHRAASAARPASPAGGGRRVAGGPLLVQASVAAVLVTATGLLVVTVVVLLAWLADPRGEADTAAALRTATRLWLVAHHVGLQVGPGRLDLAPLGLLLLPAGLLLRSGALLACVHLVRTPRRAVRLATLLAALYAGLAALVALLTSTNSVRVAPGSAAARAGALALLAGGIGALLGAGPRGGTAGEPVSPRAAGRVRRRWSISRRASRTVGPRAVGPPGVGPRASRPETRLRAPVGWKTVLRRRSWPAVDLRLPGPGLLPAVVDRVLPARAYPLVRAIAVAAGALLAAGGLLAAGSFAWHAPRAVMLGRALEPGLIGSSALFLLSAALVPNAAVWGAAYLAGPGFAVGAGTGVSPFGGLLGPVPALPLLAALPGQPPRWMTIPMVLVPVGAGALAGVVLARRPTPAWSVGDAARLAAGCGVGAGTLLAFAAWLSGGAAGPGRLAAVGPSPVRVGLAMALEVAVGAGATLAVAGWRRRHRGGSPTGD